MLATRRLALCGQVDGGMYRPQPLRYPQGRSRGHGQTRSAFGMGLRACRACRSSPAVGARGRRRAVSSSSVWLRRPRRGPCVVPACVPSGNTSGCPEKPVDQQLHAHRPGREPQRLGRQHRPAGRKCAVKTCSVLIILAQPHSRRDGTPSPRDRALTPPPAASQLEQRGKPRAAPERQERRSRRAALWRRGVAGRATPLLGRAEAGPNQDLRLAEGRRGLRNRPPARLLAAAQRRALPPRLTRSKRMPCARLLDGCIVLRNWCTDRRAS